MANDGERSDYVTEVVLAGTEVLQAADESIKLPGVSLALNVLQGAIRRRAAAKAEEFFTHLGVALGSGDADETARLVADQMDKPWIAESVDRGFRAMMNTVDDAIKPAIAALVAEYHFEKQTPDRDFQRVGALLSDCVRRDADLLKGFCGCVSELAASDHQRERIFVHRDNTPEVYLVVPGTGGEGWFTSKPFSGYGRGSGAVVSLLTRHGLGEVPPGGLSMSNLGGEALLEFTNRSDRAYLVLGRCLSAIPVRR